MAVDLIRGIDLARALAGLTQRTEKLSIDAALVVSDDIAAALDYAHRRVDLGPAGLLHLGLTPRSVMITPDGEARLLDVGLLAALARARWAADPSLLETLPYLAPEAIEGVAVDARADVFSLGALLYEMVAGQPAFGGGAAAEVRRRMVAGPAPIAQADSRLLTVLYRALAPDPAARFATVAQLAEELRTVVGTRGARVRTELGALARRNVVVPPLGHAPKGAHLEDVPPRNTFAGVGPDDLVAPLVVLPGPATEKGMAAVLAEHFIGTPDEGPKAPDKPIPTPPTVPVKAQDKDKPKVEPPKPAAAPTPAATSTALDDEIEARITTPIKAASRPTEAMATAVPWSRATGSTSQISAVTSVPRWGRVALSAAGGALGGIVILWAILSFEARSHRTPVVVEHPIATPAPVVTTPSQPPTALPLDAAIDFVTDPAGALVFVDGVATGHSPCHIAVSNGKHRLLIMGEHMKLWQKSVDVAAPLSVRAELEPTRLVAPVAGPAGLKVRCKSVHQLRIFVDGVDTGVSCPNEERIPVTIGTHRVGLYLPETDQVVESDQEIVGGNLSTRIYLDH